MAAPNFYVPTWPWQLDAQTAFFNRHETGVSRFLFRVSRQIGKTFLLQTIAIFECINRPGIYWYVAPSYDRSEEVYRELCDTLGDHIQSGKILARSTAAGWEIDFSKMVGRRSVLQLKSLGNPEVLRGATIDGLLGDEVGLWEEYVWRSILEPMLLVREGWAVFCGTPPDPFSCSDPDFMPKLSEMCAVLPHWMEIHRTYEDHPLEHVRDHIEQERAHIVTEQFEREYNAHYTNREQLKLPRYKLWGPNQTVKTHPDGVVATTIDLADNEQEFGDKASVVTSIVTGGHVLWVIAADYAKNPSEVLDLCYQHKHIYGSEWVGGQNTSFDKGFRYTVEQAEPTRGILGFIPLKIGGASKFRRILNALEPLAKQGKVFLHEDLRDLQNEWESFPKGLLGDTRRDPMAHHYDHLDALSGRGEHLFIQAGWRKKEPQAMNSVAAAVRACKARYYRGRSSRWVHDKVFRIGDV